MPVTLPVCLMDALVRELRQQGDEEAMERLEAMLSRPLDGGVTTR